MEKTSREEKQLRFLGPFGILKATIEIPFINPSFIVFTCITSFPLFCILLFPKLPFQATTIKDALFNLEQLRYHSSFLISVSSWLLHGIIGTGMDHLSELITFISIVTVIDSASTIHKGRAGRSMGLRDLLQNSIRKRRWRSMLVYCLVNLFSSISLGAVLLYIDAGPFRSLRNKWAPPLHFFTQLGAMFVRDEYSAWWQLALVTSVLEEVDPLQFEAFSISSELRRGNRFKGFVLMALYFGWRCLQVLLGLEERSGVAYAVVDKGLFCLGKVMNWVACTVYYHDCKNRQRRLEVVAKED